MQKRIIDSESRQGTSKDQGWLDLEQLGQVEITSEDVEHPIESALLAETGAGWQAAGSGEQTIRLLFDAPLRLSRIRLVFDEELYARVQEYTLRWLPAGEQSYRELLRQQYNFSPPGTTQEVEDYTLNLERVAALELRILPDISGGEARASLTRLQLA